MKDKFYIENYRGRYAMHCPNEETAKIFTKHLHDINKTWCDGSSYVDDTNFEHYTYETCYNFNCGAYGRTSTYIRNGYTILEFEDFYWVEYTDLEVPEEEVAMINTFLNDFQNS